MSMMKNGMACGLCRFLEIKRGLTLTLRNSLQ